MESENIGKGPVCPSVFAHSSMLHYGLIDFLHIGYHDQVSWSTDACKIEFGSVPNLSNYGYFFIIFSVCCDVSEKNVVILFIFGTVIRYHLLLLHVKYHLTLCQIREVMPIFFLNFIFVVISHKRMCFVHIW